MECILENGESKFGLKRSIRDKLEMIGVKDKPPVADEGPMIEAVGTRLEEKEVGLLTDLLEKMLKRKVLPNKRYCSIHGSSILLRSKSQRLIRFPILKCHGL